MMNLSAGYPFDLVRNGLPYDYPKLTRDAKADVVILGGGISGALVAWYLVKAGVNCMLVDGRTIGLGSTCASTSLLQYEIDQPLAKLSQQIGTRNAQRAYHLCGEAITELEKISRQVKHPDFTYCNSIYFAATKKDTAFLAQEFQARKQAGFGVSWMEEKELQKKYGLIAPAAIVSDLAAQTNAYTLTHALLQYLVKKDMKVFDRTLVKHIDHHKRGVTLLTEEGNKINCKKLIYATGYESVKYIDEPIVQLSSTYACAGEQFNDNDRLRNSNSLFWNTADPYLYTKITADNRIIAGGRDEPFISARKRDALLRKKSLQLTHDLKRYFPTAPFKKEFSWTGVFGTTRDGLPFIGMYPKLPNGFFALGFGGNGITFSVIAAKLLQQALTGKPSKDAGLFAFERI